MQDVPPSDTQLKDGRNGVNLYRANVLPRLAAPRERRTDVPVQLIVPLRDRFVDPELYRELPRWVPHLWRCDIDAGHWFFLARPQLLADRVRAFVALQEGSLEHAALKRAQAMAS